MTAHQAKAISNEAKEKNTQKALMELAQKSDLKIKSAAEVGLTDVVIDIKIAILDEDGFREAVYNYFENLGYKVVSYSRYRYMFEENCSITISWGDA